MSSDSGPLTHVFNMDMTCEGCSNAAKKVLEKLGDKVSDVAADVQAKTVTLKSALSPDEILETLKKTGKAVTYGGTKE